MESYLAFVDKIGTSSDGKSIYRFDFTYDTNVVWGENFNVTPSIIIPNLQPDKNCLCMTSKANINGDYIIASKNTCFSIQDCIDGIIPLFFPNIDDDETKNVYLSFGETYENVVEKLKLLDTELYEITNIENGDESSIDNLINSDELTNLSNNNEDNDDDF